MFRFSDWTDEIASESEKQQNADVTLVDDSLIVYGDYNPLTNQRPIVSGDPNVWSGKARIIPARWGVNRENDHTGNSMTVNSITVQIPKNAVGRMKRGIQLRVDACEDNPTLPGRLFTLTSDIQGGHAASRTFEFEMSGDAVVPDE